MAEPISWTEAEPELLRREQATMAELTNEMAWNEEIIHRGRRHFGWLGLAPVWPAERPQPPGLEELLDGRRLNLAVAYPEGFPMIPPILIPLDEHGMPLVPIEYRTMHEWHVVGSGALCLLQTATAWQPTNTAAELVAEASGWFAEYLLMCDDKMGKMTEVGIRVDESLDPLIASYVDG